MKKNNTGKIKVVNDNPFAIMVDVINTETGDENIKTTLQPNAMETYILTAGIPSTIRVSLDEGIEWFDIESTIPIQCVTKAYWWAYCSSNGNRYAKEIKIINNTGRTIVVDIWLRAGDWGFWEGNLGEVTLYDNETAYYYDVPAGDFIYYARYLDYYYNETLSDIYTVSRCGEHSMTWTSSKMANSEKSNMVKDSNPYLPFESLGTPSIKK